MKLIYFRQTPQYQVYVVTVYSQMWCWPTFDAESRVSLRLVRLPQKIVGENIQVKRSVSDVIKDGETLTF